MILSNGELNKGQSLNNHLRDDPFKQELNKGPSLNKKKRDDSCKEELNNGQSLNNKYAIILSRRSSTKVNR